MTSYRERFCEDIGDYVSYDSDSSEEMYESLSRLAEQAFAEHVIEQEAEHLYRCGRPNSVIYHFRIAFLPGAILIYGDIGELVLTQYNLDLGWLRGAVRSFGYFFEKARNKTPQFCPVDAAEHLDFLCEDLDEGAEERAAVEKVYEEWCPEECEAWDLESRWHLAYSSVYGDYYSATHFSPQDVWCYEAAKWFVENLREEHL